MLFRPARRRRRFAALALALAVLAALLSITPAQAEVEHPRQQWMRDSTAGLFLHWGMFTAPRHTDCASWERDVTAGGWNAGYWVDEAQKLHASYIVLATFHSRLGYARPWPSAIPGSCSTQRDFLGELVAAGKAKGVRILLYMTDDPQWHNEVPGVQTLDSAAYSAYKGQQVDLTTRDGFGMYSYDLFHEVMDNYPDLSGFWIDNDNAYWERNGLYEQIREQRPTWLLSNNNEDTPIMDTVSNEQKTGITPSYDYPQATFTPMPRLVEADYKLPTVGQWWYDGNDSAVDYRLSVGRYVANAGSSIKSLMAETAMVNGKFPPQQENFNNFMASWLPPIWSSLTKTNGGGYMYGGMQPGFWNDGAHGVITLADDNARTQYVHVQTKPTSQDLVRLRDNGYRVTDVSDVRTGKRFAFNQSGGYLSILGITDWDTYDTVFKVTTAGQEGLYPQSLLKATATAAKADHPASNLVDGSFPNYWDANGQFPVSVTLDLGQARKATYLAVNQTEWSPTHARESFGRPEDSARIKDYKVSVSVDGKKWRTVRTSAMPSRRGVQHIDIGNQVARYVKLEVLNTWSGSQAPPFYKQLRIDEIKVGHSYPMSLSQPLPLEAESLRNSRTGTARIDWCAACSGSARVTGLDRGTVTYHGVQAAAAGTYKLVLDYTAASAGSVDVRVNGGAAVKARVDSGNPEVPGSTAIAVPLQAGSNKIEISGSAGLDRIAVGLMPPASYVPKTTMTVKPSGVVWVGPGQQSVNVSAELRLDEDSVDNVRMTPVVPSGWTLTGAPVTADGLRLGQTIAGSWTITGPAAGQTGPVQVPVEVTFDTVGLPHKVSKVIPIQVRPADRVFMREAESSLNKIGSAGITNCSPCSGGQKVRNLGGSADAHVVIEDATVPQAGQYQLYLDYTVNGNRSYFVSVNGGAPVEAAVSGIGNNTVQTVAVPVTLQAGPNTIRIFNTDDSAPDLDRISLG
ncbi:carbohydrate-binding protein with CBM35 doain [Kribbella sp. VKM Ac-2527]|uniref:alpha-L-fucosidase n=1 Tax=Kribbella caucasensis TaxID=2512215 RepID=A0A4R6J476_9ACTN|nr:CBM35 domain-containing protein [Kribbella sp. VKM Ac-2527]TDO30180.1 carbohydrate-binding protein with CBM35 doain [Kribbella sp. VKM Ac-2527]